MEQTLPALNSQRYELFSVVPISTGIGSTNAAMLYTLTAPLSGALQEKIIRARPALTPQSQAEASILWGPAAIAHCV